MIDAIAGDPDQTDDGIRILRGEAVRTAPTEKVLLYHLSLSDLLNTAELLNCCPPEITLIGVVPERLAMGTEPSAAVTGRMPRIITLARDELARWGLPDPDTL